MLKKFIRVLFAVAGFAIAFWVVIGDKKVETSNDELPVRLKATFAYQAAKWYNDQRAFPAGHIPSTWKAKAFSHIRSNNSLLGKTTSGVSQLAWQSIGPSNIAGRIRSILIDPLHPDTLYVGSVSGGIWKTTNEGSSWFPTSDVADNLCIGTMVMDPTNPNIIYAGTGEGYFNIDALRGAGILKSTNGGASWTLLNNFPNTDPRFLYYFINKLVINPDNPNILYAAMIGGVWKTTNAGTTWTKLNVNSASIFCMDLIADPDDPEILYAAFGLGVYSFDVSDGVYKTTDGGSTWTKLSNGFPNPNTGYARISLTVSSGTPKVLYASLADSNYYTHSVQKSTNGGDSWFSATTPYDNLYYVRATHLGGQGFYNNVIAVHPQTSSTVYAGGINIFKSTNGGTSWGNALIDANGASNFHVDQHVIAFHPQNPSIMYFGNDGGIYKSTNGGSTFTSLNNNLSITQFYSGAVHPTENTFFGGTQDNGTLRAENPPGWIQILSGDGGPVLVDFLNPSNIYMSYVYMMLFKSTDGGNTRITIMNGIPTVPGAGWTSDRCSFIAPFIMDPTNPQTLYSGSYRLFKSTNGGDYWSIITSDLTGSGPGDVQTAGAYITAISVAKSNPSVLYVGTSGWTGVRSRVLRSTNGGNNWTTFDSPPLPNREVTSIAIDPLNANKVFVSYSGYNANTSSTPGHVFLTTNQGATWSNMSGNLPDIPVNTILINPQQRDHLIVGTDLGIFESTNGGTTWIQQNDGLANVAIADLDLRSDGYILAATHGRGMFLSTSDLYSGLALYFPAENAANIATTVTLRWKQSDSASVYRLNVGTDPNFTFGIVYSDTALAETTKTIAGLSLEQAYYWQVGIRKQSGNIAYSPIWKFTTISAYPATFNASGSVIFPDLANRGSYNPSHYRLVGLPGAGGFKVDSLLGGTHKEDWQVYRDNGASSDYLEEFNGSSEFRFTEGRGFWLLHKGKWNFSATVPSVPLNSGAVQIPLHSGWNIITNPYPFFITWQTVQAANSLSDPLWGFYGSFYSSYAMEPYNGYYFFNGSSLTSLTIPYGNSLGKNISDADRAGIEWKLPIRLESDSLIDASASLGVASTASNGWDKLDVRRPRAVGDLPAVVFVRPEWDDKFSSFATDFKPEFQDVQTWEFQVYVNKGKKGTLTVGELSQLPERFEVYLLDKERGKAQNLRTRSSYEFLSSNDVSQFELVVGSSEAIHERVRNVAPRSFSLSNNYPNPFNPVTTFEYLLPRAVHVSFKMYNLAGEEVAVLRSGYEESGEYVVRWDATGVPSGVYFARLVAGEFTSVKKVLLVK